MASRRRYLTTAELSEYVDITIYDSAEADAQISQAEELIDSYIGTQVKAVGSKFVGQATSGTTTTLIDTSDDSTFVYNTNYFDYCEIEIIAGTNAGQIRQIVSSDPTPKTITVGVAFTSAIDNTSVYKIRQLGKFPRHEDVYSLNNPNNSNLPTYYKTIPEAVKRAVAAQMEYIMGKGLEFFSGASDDVSESIGDYSHTTKTGVNKLIAPKARELLKGMTNRLGMLI